MIFGILTLVLCILLLLKFTARIMKLKKFEKLLRALHIPLGFTVLIVVTVHIFITQSVWDTRSVLVIITGVVTTIIISLMAVGYIFRKKLGKWWILSHRIGALLILIVMLSHILVYYIDFFDYKKNISSITISSIDISNCKDGTYTGEYNAGYIYAKVRVSVNNKKIENIDILEHRNERGTPAERIVKDIVKQQKTDVDTISSATNSSLVIEKAVENALKQGK